MADKMLNARVKNKRDTSANWTSNDPVLLDGEIILVDTNNSELRFKVGDGTKRYSQLPFTDEPIRALIQESQVNADWDEDDSTDLAYIQNRPAIRAGAGTNSIIEGQIEDASDVAVYTLTISGDANATSFTYTTNDTIPASRVTARALSYAYYEDGTAALYRPHKIISISKSGTGSSATVDQTGTIVLTGSLSTTAITNGTLLIYYKVKNQTFGVSSAHAEGMYTIAFGHAEGQGTVAAAGGAHAEGVGSVARSSTSHAEGLGTLAYDIASHAEGGNSIAYGSGAHAEGYGTIANGLGSHAEGKYNIQDMSNTYAHIVGNGTNAARSNAYTLDWSGNGVYAGKVTVGTGPTGDMDVATKQYVDATIPVTATITTTTTWAGDGPYTQTVTVTGATITSNSKVDLQPDATSILQLVTDGVVALYVENNNGTLTMTSIGAAPSAALTLQCTITEVD